MNYTLHRGNDTFNLIVEFGYYPPTRASKNTPVPGSGPGTRRM